MKNIGDKQETKLPLLLPKEDVVFQALFGTKGSERILGGFLSKILGKKVENISLDANQNLVRETAEQKLGILDLSANVGKNMTVNIEVQMVDPYNMPKRLLYYWSRKYGIQLQKGENYNKLKKTITILIANYDIKGLEYFQDAHTLWKLLEIRNPNVEMFEDIEMHVIELPKILKYPKATDKNLSTWLEFLSNPESESVKMVKRKDKILCEAYDKLAYISGNERLRRIADLRLKAILDENSIRNGSRQEGLAEGRTDALKETSKKLLKMGLTIEQIIEATGLTKEEIEKLQ